MDLGNRIKEYEMKSENFISKDEHIIIRIDGHHFSKFTKGLKKPFDNIFRTAMIKTTKDLHDRFNAYTSYTQSDEITLFLSVTKDKKINKNLEHQFNGRTQKLSSLCASFATICFNKHLRNLIYTYRENFDLDDYNGYFRKSRNEEWDYYITLINKMDLAYFDARVFGVPNIEEVANVFIWRARDCIKNSKGTFAQAYASHKELQNMNSEEQIQYTLQKYNKDWNIIEDKYKYGVLIKKELYDKIHENVVVKRSKLIELYIPMNSYSKEIVDLIQSKYIEN